MDYLQKFYELHLKIFVKKDFKDLDVNQKELIKTLPAYHAFVQMQEKFKNDLIKAAQ